MKAKIVRNGTLHVDRGAKVENWKPMVCPFCSETDVWCGDWCPHFNTFTTSTSVQVTMCHGSRIVIPLENFTDERP